MRIMPDEPPRHDTPVRRGRPAPSGMPAGIAYLVVVCSPLLIFFAFGMMAVFGSHSRDCDMSNCWATADNAGAGAIVFGIPLAVIEIAFGCGTLALLRLWTAYRRLPIIVQGLIPSVPMFCIAIGILTAI